MNYWILGAALISGLTVLAHIFGGGPEVLAPMLQSELSVYLQTIWTVVWHAISAILIIGTAVLVYGGIKPQRLVPAVTIVCAQYLAFAVLFLFYGITELGTLWPMPQWTAFTLIPLLAGIGLHRDARRTPE